MKGIFRWSLLVLVCLSVLLVRPVRVAGAPAELTVLKIPYLSVGDDARFAQDA